tara:strand:- start:333 stop:509 length:177 start_codon:yes stop_codon:yes gene_type:complete
MKKQEKPTRLKNSLVDLLIEAIAFGGGYPFPGDVVPGVCPDEEPGRKTEIRISKDARQ